MRRNLAAMIVAAVAVLAACGGDSTNTARATDGASNSSQSREATTTSVAAASSVDSGESAPSAPCDVAPQAADVAAAYGIAFNEPSPAEDSPNTICVITSVENDGTFPLARVEIRRYDAEFMKSMAQYAQQQSGSSTDDHPTTVEGMCAPPKDSERNESETTAFEVEDLSIDGTVYARRVRWAYTVPAGPTEVAYMEAAKLSHGVCWKWVAGDLKRAADLQHLKGIMAEIGSRIG